MLSRQRHDQEEEWGVTVKALYEMLGRHWPKEEMVWWHDMEYVDGISVSILLCLVLGINISIVQCWNNGDITQRADAAHTVMDVQATHIGLKRRELIRWREYLSAEEAKRSGGEEEMAGGTEARGEAGACNMIGRLMALDAKTQQEMGHKSESDSEEDSDAGEEEEAGQPDEGKTDQADEWAGWKATECIRDILYLKRENLGVPQRSSYEDYATFWGRSLVEQTTGQGEGVCTAPVITLLRYKLEGNDEEGRCDGHYDNMWDINVELEEMGLQNDPRSDLLKIAGMLDEAVSGWRNGDKERCEAETANARARKEANERRRALNRARDEALKEVERELVAQGVIPEEGDPIEADGDRKRSRTIGDQVRAGNRNVKRTRLIERALRERQQMENVEPK